MRKVFVLCGLLLCGSASVGHAQEKGTVKKTSVHQFQVTTIDGQKIDLAKYKGKVLLIVNVASECGYTDQYKGMQALHAKYGKDGLAVLAFPCNDFGGQEPAGEAKIKEFAKKNYGVNFDLFSKVKILGKDAAPLYQFLTAKDTNPKHAGEVKWNFEKFIIGRDGTIIARFTADVDPESEDVVNALRKELDKR
jgi:glutathione peroxidase